MAELRDGPATRRQSVGAGAAYGLAAVVLLLGGFAAWLLLGACGVRAFGQTYQFPWCEAREVSLASLREEEARNRAMRDQVHDAELALMTPEACGPPVEPVQDPPEAPETIEEAVQCAPGTEPQRPPQRVALVIDGSGSMEYSVDLPVELEAEYLRTFRARQRAQQAMGGGFGGGGLGSFLQMAENAQRLSQLEQREMALQNRLDAVPGRSRADVARDVMRDVVRQAPEALTLDLTVFTDCDDIRTRSHPPGDRDGAISTIDRLVPDGGTPLARSMEQAARSLQSQAGDAERVTMVLVTDGNDSCQADPCGTARALKAQMPNLAISVIDLSQNDTLQCIADVTGGSYSRTRGTSMPEFNDMVEEAAGYGEASRCAPAENGQEPESAPDE